MPHSFFILQRHFLRVDGVLFRVRDVRLFHLFSSNKIIREVSGWEAPYDAVKAVRPGGSCPCPSSGDAPDRCLPLLSRQRLPPPFTDLSPLSNPGWVHQVLSGADGRRVPEGIKLEEGAKAWPGLGKVTEVLELPAGGGRQKLDEVTQGVEGLSV